MPTILVTARDADSLVTVSESLDLSAELLLDGRVRVASSQTSSTPEALAADLQALGNRFGITSWEAVA